MSRATLEERVTALEKKIDDLLDRRVGANREKDWRRTRGAFTGDDLMKQVFDEGRKIRESERKRTHPRKAKPRRARS
jgi:hypothetical protein